LNGVELLRENLPSQPITPSIYATASISGADETAWRSFIVPAAALQQGSNVIAVEIHQATPNSSDLGFDLRLSGIAQSSVDYPQWRALRFGSDSGNSAIAGESANPDTDAQGNLVEYALGGNPTFGDEGPLSTMDAASGRLSLRFSRYALATDITVNVLGADDLEGPWLQLARSVNGQPFEPSAPGTFISESLGGAFRDVEVRDVFQIGDPAHPSRFLRLQITK